MYNEIIIKYINSKKNVEFYEEERKEMISLDICPPGKILADDQDASEPSISLLEVMQALPPIPRLSQPISSTLKFFDQKNCQQIS